MPEHIRERLQKDTIVHWRNPKNFIVLTEAEREYILTQFAQPSIWHENLLPNSRLITKDSMWIVMKEYDTQKKLAMKEAISQGDTATFHTVRRTYLCLTSFLKPIYIRNNTVCLFGFATLITVSGDGVTIIQFYKKEDNQWKPWIVVEQSER